MGNARKIPNAVPGSVGQVERQPIAIIPDIGRRSPPPWSVEVSVDDLRYCSRCGRSRLPLQSFSVRLRWHRQHPRRPNIVARRRPIRRLITRPHMEPAAVSRTVPRVYRQTRLAGQNRIAGDRLAIGGQAAHQDETRRIAANIEAAGVVAPTQDELACPISGIATWSSPRPAAATSAQSRRALGARPCPEGYRQPRL